MEKRFYWIKLKTDFFNQEAIDFLMSQENGCQYIVLYQMLCLKTANNNGNLSTQIGEVIIPYDVKKIVRDTKYFDIDTVTVALELFKRLGLVYEEEDKILRITDISEMVGSETSSAKRVREHRARKALQCNTEVTQEIEFRDKSKEIDNKKEEKRKEEKKTGYDDILEARGIRGKKRYAILEYIKMRKLIKKPLTDHALELALNNLEKLSSSEDEQIAILEQSISNSWQGLFPLKGSTQNDVGKVAHAPQDYDYDFDLDKYLEDRKRSGK